MDNKQTEGKKIFLLRPHSVIHQNMLDTLIMSGYETYTLLNEDKARRLLINFPGSIMFINIDEGNEEKQWEAYIRGIQENPQTKNSKLGIMSYNQDKNLMQKYLMEISIPCGYIQLKLGLNESTKIILNALEANEARGRRNFFRVDCEKDLYATVNYTGLMGRYRGKILDISSVGIAVKFDKFEILPTNSILRGVQLKIRGGLILTDLIFLGNRGNNKNIYIFLFDPKMSQENKIIIYRYLKTSLQKYIDDLNI